MGKLFIDIFLLVNIWSFFCFVNRHNRLLVILILIFLSISGKPSNHSNDKPVSPEPLPFSAETFYIEFPEYLFLGEKDGIYYIAAFPTDVQFDMDNEENTNLYYKIREVIDTILETFIMK